MRRFHLVGFPHTTLDGHPSCAYSQKVAKFARMGWGDRLSVYHGGGTLADPELPPEWPDERAWRKFNAKTIRLLRREANRGDLLLVSGGASQEEIVRQMWDTLMPLEYGIGYEGVIPDTHHAYESAAWRHTVYGKRGWNDGRPFDTVIPNSFDPDEFPYLNDGRGDYLLFVGRIVLRKGPHVAGEIAARAGMPLKVAGPLSNEIGVPDGAEYLGVLGIEERARVMAEAAALIVPTLYVEPFGGVAVEAMMCGTPVVASDWGAFTETVEEGVTGYRFSTVQEGVGAVLRAIDLPPQGIRDRALERFSLAAVKPLYEWWFGRIETLWGDGYYEGGEIFSDRREMMPA